MEIIEILMQRDNLTRPEAEEILEEMRNAVAEGDDPYEVLQDQNLEPDYFLDLMNN